MHIDSRIKIRTNYKDLNDCIYLKHRLNRILNLSIVRDVNLYIKIIISLKCSYGIYNA